MGMFGGISRATAVAGIIVAALAIPPLGAASAQTSLTPQTASMLQSIAVEEKIAQDAYREFATRYDEPDFSNMATSEARHRDTLGALLAKHSIPDPTIGDAAGVFDDAARQAQYNELTARGAVSLTNAAEAGTQIERMLIASLSDVAAVDLPRDAMNVVTNLREGARHHLAAFEALLARAVTTTTPPTTGQLAQTAQIRAQRSGRYRVGTRLMLAPQPARTDAGVTVRWRALAQSRDVCRVRTRDGRSTVQLLRPGVCRVLGYAPAPSPEHLEFRLERTYRAYG